MIDLFNLDELTGRNVLVTGATSGIGLGIAKAMAKAGCHVMINGFGDPDDIESMRKDLEDETGRIIVYSPADLTIVSDIEAMFSDFQIKLGKVDAVINNAGRQHVAPVESFPVDMWDQIIALNLTAAFHTTRLSFQGMKERGWGRIINIASAHGLTASPFKSAYVTSKHGLLGLTKTVALEGAEHGVCVNAVCPGYVQTPLVENQIASTAQTRGMTEEEVISKVILERQPTKSFTQIDHIASMCVFLMTSAASNITGAEIKMDGGWTAL